MASTPDAELPDAPLVRRSLEHPEAFGAIFDRHAATLMRYLVRRVGRTTAEDLLSEVMRTAFEARARFDTARSSALPWLYGIASNLVLKHRRTEARRLRATARLASEDGTGAGAGADAGEELGARELLLHVAEEIEMLPPQDRDLLLLFAWEGQGYGAIGEALGIPVGTVRSRLHRVRERLRERIASGGKEQDMQGEPGSEARCRP